MTYVLIGCDGANFVVVDVLELKPKKVFSSYSRVWKDPDLIREMTLETIKGFPAQEIEMVKNGDLTSYFIVIHSFEVSTVALSSRTISKRNRDGGRRLCGIGSMPGSKNAG
ncbi:hypothetical protein ACOSQ3_003780 [Xanthoceras sorbifolium]